MKTRSLLFVVLLSLVGFTSQGFAQARSDPIKLEPCQKLVHASWIGHYTGVSISILTRPMRRGEQAETHELRIFNVGDRRLPPYVYYIVEQVGSSCK